MHFTDPIIKQNIHHLQNKKGKSQIIAAGDYISPIVHH